MLNPTEKESSRQTAVASKESNVVDAEDLNIARVFGLELQSLRKDHNFRGAEFAKKIGVTGQWLSAVENAYVHPTRGLTKVPDKILRKISEELEWPMIDIYMVLGRITAADLDVYNDMENEAEDEMKRLYGLGLVPEGQTTTSSPVPRIRGRFGTILSLRRMVRQVITQGRRRELPGHPIGAGPS